MVVVRKKEARKIIKRRIKRIIRIYLYELFHHKKE